MTVWLICMVGTQPSTADSLLSALSECDIAPAAALAALAEAAANRDDATLVGCGLRLVDDHLPTVGAADARTIAGVLDSAVFDDAVLDSAVLGPAALARVLGTLYERLLSDDTRKSSGAHFTPSELAGRLIAAAVDGWDRQSAPETLDPSCGGGAFLLAAASYLEDRWGLSRAQSVALLHGIDTDATAVAVAETSLALWCLAGGEQPQALDQLGAGDGLLDPLPSVDLVVGNPPFLNQLAGRTARSARQRSAVRDRFANLVGPYGDTAALFLLAGAEALRPGGRMVLIQPQSILASRDIGRIREWLSDNLRLHGLWHCTEQVFSASVLVCAPVFEQPAGRRVASALSRWSGPTVIEAEPWHLAADGSIEAASWGPLVADLVGIPRVKLPPSTPIGTLAKVTAGFRDQFYGFADHTAESDADPTGAMPAAVTVGMIDPLHARWGSGVFRYAGETWERPVVDLAAVEQADANLANWATDRLQPKVLMATQTRVIEVVADPAGTQLPITPVISIEPDAEAAESLSEPLAGWWAAQSATEQVWLLAAALMAPPVTAWGRAHRLGTAMSGDALKLSATDVASIPLPTDRGAWETGADHARSSQAAQDPQEWRTALEALGLTMTQAYGVDADDPLLAWWTDRLPDWR